MQTTSSLHVLDLSIEVLRELAPLVQRIGQADRSLADQIRRAANSVVLNLGEAARSNPGNRRARLHSAMGSANEVRVALRAAAAWGSVSQTAADAVDDKLDRVVAMTWRWLHPRR